MYNSIYPGYVNYYPGLNKKQIEQKKDDEKNPRRSQNAENPFNSERNGQISNSIGQNNSLNPKYNSSLETTFPNGTKTAIDYTKRQINIQQVLIDFTNTTNAIGAPDDIKKEVETYLNLVQSQSLKENPNTQIIQANLKNASQILDEYITKTLNKPSKVVESWVDALFLQKIDYKMPAEEALASNSEETDETDVSQTEANQTKTVKQNDFYIPLDEHLKRMFIQAKKYSAIDNKEKALSAFQDVAEYAEETGDMQAAAIAYYEQGRIYDDFNRPEDALYNYNMAIADTEDNNIKARAHISMGQIYDDYVEFEPAVNHYCAAVSFAGESDNINLQTKALTNLAKIHANRYDKDNTYLFMNLANKMADETKDNKTKGITFASSANCCSKLNEKSKALRLYGESAQAFSEDNYYEGLANDYLKAGDIMLQFGNKAKAKKLFYKAFIAMQQCDNPELKQEITDKITSL